QPVFIDPTTDEGFKRLFGDKINLINFLNIIFRGRKTIVDLTYRDTERIGATEEIGKVIFDLVVQISTGEEIIIEMQTSNQTNLKQRMLYYASKVISDTAPKGNRKAWGYAIPEVYTIVLMDGFHMPGGDHKTYFHDTCLCNRDSGQIFYEGLGFIYLEIINFVKSEAEVEDELD
ncbi:PD-(D/E)XK nuclease family transposase, partial [Sphingobacterium kitahiroshimense]